MPDSHQQINGEYSPRLGLIVAFYAFIAIGMGEGGLGVLLPSIMTSFHLTPATVTWLFLSQITGYIVAAFSSSIISNHIGLARMLLLASILLSGALIVYASTPVWGVMVITGTALGLGIGLIDAGINTYIVNDARHSHFIGVLHGFYGTGALLDPAIATTLLGINLHWRIVYVVFASVVGLLSAVLIWVIKIDYQPLTHQVTVSGGDARANLRTALGTPTVLISGFFLLVYVGTEVAIGNWAYSVQTISRNTPLIIAGYSVSAYWMGLTIGRMGMGYAIKYLGTIRLLDFSLTLLTVGALSWWLLPEQVLSLPLLGLALAAIFPTTILLVPQRVAMPLVPATIGFLSSVASFGAATIPSGLGFVANSMGLSIIPIMMLPLAALMMLLHRWLVSHPFSKV
ncbi:major facilitator superfamily MFS_1 [Crinalium epipsammum PCC 9333]|uniref:Major facilitator superfamily MFS_1 n=1 Tax=Crinalium epipsammum PCC 9333 TaxID=1173022 RepID=K9W4M8_9CYAN|nr:MFS transporter [Crinalium epipsammum]AFZ14749.1 major facilitator superfamily MFS_1 [Crinalium epipsammum PCC 9333]